MCIFRFFVNSKNSAVISLSNPSHLLSIRLWSTLNRFIASFAGIWLHRPTVVQSLRTTGNKCTGRKLAIHENDRPWPDLMLKVLNNVLYVGPVTVLSNVDSRPRSLCRPSVVCLSVTLVCRSQTVEIFGNFSTPFGTLVLTSTENFTDIVRGEPLRRRD